MKKFNFSNLSKPAKTVLIFSIILTSVVAFDVLLPLIEASSVTRSLSLGTNVIDLRDISNTANQTSTITAEKVGSNLKIQVIDPDANADFLTAEIILASATSDSSISDYATTVLTETRMDSGIFIGTITLSNAGPTSGSTLKENTGDNVSIFYLADPNDDIDSAERISSGISIGKPRAQVTFEGISGPGPLSATIKDFSPFDPLSADPCPFFIVTEYVDVDLSPGTSATGITITMSYANARASATGLDPILFPVEQLNIGYRIAPGGATVSLNPGLGDGVDTDAFTVTNVLQPSDVGGVVEGQYVLGWPIGCGGGGGGGLVRPSLVVNALAGIGSFGGGADASPPTVYLADLVQFSHLEIPLEIEQMILDHDSAIPISPMNTGLFENFDYPMTINDQGFVLGGFTNTIETQTIKTDSTVEIKFVLYETSKIQHISFYTNLRDKNSEIHQSDTQILYNDGQAPKIIDPNGFFSDASVTINEINENKKEAVFELTFANPMETSDIIIRSWDPHLNSRDVFILGAIEVVSENIEEIPTPIFEEPVFEEIQSQSIPVWIKNNAAWWSDQQIGDSDFVSGIEYLIKNKIINVPGVGVGTNSGSTDIPDWIKNNAGWWADSLITDDDFIEAMQWLVANGVIKI